jgi:diadenosine tetraphosphatase ApaH/serine/threonine PP2A family protein phosphatase
MRFAIFGDIHANLEAFEATLADAEREKCDRFICLGDIVGYNADPKACLARIKELGCPVVKGNHDEYASSSCSLETFNPLAESAIRWTRQTLSPAEKEFLTSLPLTADVESFTIVHATLDSPGDWGYVLNQLDAAASFSRQQRQLCFFGHTHSPRLFVKDGSVAGFPLSEVKIEPKKQYFINVGSVGQPRDGDWRAAYAIYDLNSRKVTLRRLKYDIEKAQAKIRIAGLPLKLAERLNLGR